LFSNRSIQIVALSLLAVACSKPKPVVPDNPPPAAAPAVAAEPAPVNPSPAPDAATENAPVKTVASTPVAVAVPVPVPVETPAAAVAQDVKPPQPSPDPLKQLEESEKKRVEYEQLLARLATERDTAAAAVAQREKDLLAFKNPYMARPKLATADSEKIEGMGGAARAEWAQAQVDAAKDALDKAQKAYDDAKNNPPN
jgi:hypothetical protein